MQQNNNHTNTKNDFNESKHHDAKLKLAIIGSRGYPYVYSGYETLVKHAIAGIRSMPARGGNAELTDGEVANAVAYMANQAGANFKAP